MDPGQALPEFTFHDWTDVLLRITLALIAGAVVGMDREWRNKSAGLRTHAVVCVGAALAMMIAIAMQAATDTGGDLVYGVVAGIGFLGGGAIIRYGKSVRGLVTGASIWSSAVIGLGFGLGWYLASGITTAFIVASLWAFQYLEVLLNPAQRVVAVRAETEPDVRFPKQMLTDLPEMQYEILGVGFDRGRDGDNGCICFEVRTPSNLTPDVLVSILTSEDWVIDAEVVDGPGTCDRACSAPREGAKTEDS
jgi:putative Mg2+ transporter-C (MgtC) family protein